MNYSKIYSNLIYIRSKIEPLKKSKELYSELHHIKPRCLGGDDSDSNLVRLTAREHFLAHRLLAKIYPKNVGLSFAALHMGKKGKTTKNKINSKGYQKLRETVSAYVSKNNRERFANLTEEEKLTQIAKMCDANKSMTSEQRLAKAKKISLGHALISEDRKKEIASKKSKSYKSIPKEKRELLSNIVSESNRKRFKAMSIEELEQHGRRISQGHKNRTIEQNEIVSAAVSKGQANMKPEIKAERKRKLREAALLREANMSKEEKDLRAKRMKEGRERKRLEKLKESKTNIIC